MRIGIYLFLGPLLVCLSLTTWSQELLLHPDFKVGSTRYVSGTTRVEVYEGDLLTEATTTTHKGRMVVLQNTDSVLVLGFLSSGVALNALEGEEFDDIAPELFDLFNGLGKELANVQLEVEVNPETLIAKHVRNMPEVLSHMVGAVGRVMEAIPETDLDWEVKADAMQIVEVLALILQGRLMESALADINAVMQYYGFGYEVGEEVEYEGIMTDEHGFGPFRGVDFPVDLVVDAREDEQRTLTANIYAYYDKAFLAEQLFDKKVIDAPVEAEEVEGFEHVTLEFDLDSHWMVTCNRVARTTVEEVVLITEERMTFR